VCPAVAVRSAQRAGVEDASHGPQDADGALDRGLVDGRGERGFACVHARVQVEHHGATGGREQHRPPPPVSLVVFTRDQVESLKAGDETRHGGRVHGQVARQRGGGGAAILQSKLPQYLELGARHAELGRRLPQEDPIGEEHLAHQVHVRRAWIVLEEPCVVLGDRKLIHDKILA
jgi:hypothetical protein